MPDEQNQQDPQTTTQEAGGAAAGESSGDGGAAASAPTASPMSTASVAPTAESDSSITDPMLAATDAPAVAEPGEGSKSAHHTALEELVGAIRKTFNMLGGELEAAVRKAEDLL